MTDERHATQSPSRAEIRELCIVWGLLIVGLIFAIATDPVKDWMKGVLPEWEHAIGIAGFGLEHLGLVIFVAMVVRLLIEKASQREFLGIVNTHVKVGVESSIREIASNALSPLQSSIQKLDEELGFAIRRPGLLDEQSKTLLRDKVLNPTFIRPEFSVHLVLEPILNSAGAKSGFLRVSSRSIFTVKNITDRPANYNIEAWVDDTPPATFLATHETSRFTYFVCGPESRRAENELRPFNLERLSQTGKIAHDGGSIWLKHEITEGIAAGQSYYVHVDSLQIMRDQDLFVWNVSSLTNKLQISVELAGGLDPEEFLVQATEMHHVGHAAFRDTMRREGAVISWEIDRVLLPYQGVKIWWSPRVKDETKPEMAVGHA